MSAFGQFVRTESALPSVRPSCSQTPTRWKSNIAQSRIKKGREEVFALYQSVSVSPHFSLSSLQRRRRNGDVLVQGATHLFLSDAGRCAVRRQGERLEGRGLMQLSVLGDIGVGKTCLVHRFVSCRFVDVSRGCVAALSALSS